MNRSDASLEASYAFCRRMARRSGSSFYPCFRLLRRSKRPAMDALYAFMRHTDDLADGMQPAPDRRQALDRWRDALTESLENGMPSGESLASKLLPAVRDTVRRFAIPPEHLQAVIDGVEMDLDERRYETFDELAEYCHRVASAVGLACVHVWGFRDASDKIIESARNCGLAFQLTNILRDLGPDIEQGRLYLPLEDLRACDYTADDLAAGVTDERFERLMRLEIDRARAFYREGSVLGESLEPDGRRIFGMMHDVYQRLLDKIAHEPSEVLRRRIRLTRLEKYRIGARWLFR